MGGSKEYLIVRNILSTILYKSLNMSRVSGKAAGQGNGSLPIDSVFTWNCNDKGWVFSPTKDTKAHAKDIRGAVIRSDMYKIGGNNARGYFNSHYGCRGIQKGQSVETWFKPKQGQVKMYGRINWWDVREKPEFEDARYNNIILIKAISYKIVENGVERDATEKDPKVIALRMKGFSWKALKDAVDAFKVKLSAEGKGNDASQIGPDELETCYIAYLSGSLIDNKSTYGNTNTYPVPQFALLPEKQADLEKEAGALYQMFGDELLTYWAKEVSVSEDYDDSEDKTPSTPPPPPQAPTGEIDDLPF